ncbi:hypothetical protein ACQPYH_23135 [Kribbella sp. CA-245084]|uniref:hypothetical protein n=1 Tax=Kribbella sp. CA-245084 TaxID=3239940 RepID=UPI003D8AAAED
MPTRIVEQLQRLHAMLGGAARTDRRDDHRDTLPSQNNPASTHQSDADQIQH